MTSRDLNPRNCKLFLYKEHGIEFQRVTKAEEEFDFEAIDEEGKKWNFIFEKNKHVYSIRKDWSKFSNSLTTNSVVILKWNPILKQARVFVEELPEDGAIAESSAAGVPDDEAEFFGFIPDSVKVVAMGRKINSLLNLRVTRTKIYTLARYTLNWSIINYYYYGGFSRNWSIINYYYYGGFIGVLDVVAAFASPSQHILEDVAIVTKATVIKELGPALEREHFGDAATVAISHSVVTVTASEFHQAIQNQIIHLQQRIKDLSVGKASLRDS